MGLWAALSGREMRESDERWEERQKEQASRISAVEAAGDYRSALAHPLSEMWVCRRCGALVGDRPLHDQAVHTA